MKKKNIIENYLHIWLLFPFFVIIGLLVIYPVTYLAKMSLYSTTLYRQGEFIWFSNYIKTFLNPSFRNSVKVTLVFIIVSTTIELLWGLGLALALNKVSGRVIQIIRGCFVFPLIIMPIAVASIWQLMYFPLDGAINVIFRLLNISPQQWLSTKAALPSIILVEIWQRTPFTILILLSGVRAIPLGLYEASAIDGASYWQNTRYITLPLLRPLLILCVIFNAMRQIKTFDIVYALTRGGPEKITSLISYEIYQRAYRTYKISEAAAMSVVLLGTVITLTIIFLRYILKIGKEA